MEELGQAKRLLDEAVRLHPRHPVVLGRMAEVLYSLEEYEKAKEYIDKVLFINVTDERLKLKSQIESKLQQQV